MNAEEWQRECVFQCSEEDHKLFNLWTAGLPERKETTPYHSLAHCIRPMRMAFKEVIQWEGGPRVDILEIGFCLGHSAKIWLNLGDSSVVSLENSDRPETLAAASLMTDWHDSRFVLARTRDSVHFASGRFNLAYIDGDHSYEAIREDIRLCRALGIKSMLLDDVILHWGPDTLRAITDEQLPIRWQCGNMIFCQDL